MHLWRRRSTWWSWPSRSRRRSGFNSFRHAIELLGYLLVLLFCFIERFFQFHREIMDVLFGFVDPDRNAFVVRSEGVSDLILTSMQFVDLFRQLFKLFMVGLDVFPVCF